MKRLLLFGVYALIFFAGCFVFQYALRYIQENRVLKEIVSRLEADSRIAEAVVTDTRYDEADKKTYTTIKFVEYDTQGDPLPAKYFTFPGNVIQFQSLVVRFDDLYIRNKDRLRGRSMYLFWKVFMLAGPNTVEYEISKVNEIPRGYKLDRIHNRFEREIWERFWEYALITASADKQGIKNAQIEAPGTKFFPWSIYTLKIEHDGGMRIDVKPFSPILKGEKIL